MKSALRKKLLSVRKKLPVAALTYSALMQYEEFKNAKAVFCYVSTFGEVDTVALLSEIAEHKTLTVPYCTDNNGNMIAVQITSLNDLQEGRFGIPGPKNPVLFPKQDIDFVIVPGIAFSHDMYRLGYGKGYYDRFLSDISPFKLGVCKKELIIEKLPYNEYDIKMNSVLAL